MMFKCACQCNGLKYKVKTQKRKSNKFSSTEVIIQSTLHGKISVKKLLFKDIIHSMSLNNCLLKNFQDFFSGIDILRKWIVWFRYVSGNINLHEILKFLCLSDISDTKKKKKRVKTYKIFKASDCYEKFFKGLLSWIYIYIYIRS